MRKNPVKAIVVDDERLPRLALLQKLDSSSSTYNYPGRTPCNCSTN